MLSCTVSTRIYSNLTGVGVNERLPHPTESMFASSYLTYSLPDISFDWTGGGIRHLAGGLLLPLADLEVPGVWF